jgi:hypothetical protein
VASRRKIAGLLWRRFATDNAAMNAEPKPKRRWFQFSLRTLLVVVTHICLALTSWQLTVGFFHVRSGLALLYFCVTGAILGAGIGSVWAAPFRGAIFGLAVWSAFWLVYLWIATPWLSV